MAERVVAPSPQRTAPEENLKPVEDIVHPDATSSVQGRGSLVGEQWRVPAGFDYVACAIAAILIAQVLYWALPQYNVASEFIRKEVYVKSERGDTPLVMYAAEGGFIHLLERKTPPRAAQQFLFSDGGFIRCMKDTTLVLAVDHNSQLRLVERADGSTTQRWFWDGQRLASVHDPELVIRAANDNRVVAARRLANDTHQLWRQLPDKSIESLHKYEYVLEAVSASSAGGGRGSKNGFVVYGRERAGRRTQLWVFYEDGSVRNRDSGMYLQVSGNNDLVVLSKQDSIEAASLAARSPAHRWWHGFVPEFVRDAVGSAYGAGKDENGALVPSPLQKWVVLSDGSIRSGLGRNFVVDLDDQNRAILWERKATRRPNQSWALVEKEKEKEAKKAL